MEASQHLAWRRIARSVFLMILGVAFFALAARLVIPLMREPQPFAYDFDVEGALEETESFEESSSEYWWLDSGGRLLIEGGVGKTIRGALPSDDRWRRRYAESSAEDTADGRYPQNLFRLVTQGEWDDVAVEARFRVVNDNETASANRNESNGLLLLSRYQDGDNLYYAGLRVDGHAVIKKKIRGVYTTLAERPVFPGEYNDANLLPHNEWITLRSETKTAGNSVHIVLTMKDPEGAWQELLRATDSTSPILTSGHVGIRTDFMDVEFDDFKAISL